MTVQPKQLLVVILVGGFILKLGILDFFLVISSQETQDLLMLNDKFAAPIKTV